MQVLPDMKPINSKSPRVTVGIPLYRSARFLDTIIENIEAMPADGVEILISDRHCEDDALERLSVRFEHDQRVRCFAARDCIDWVANINFMLGQARGEYWRFLPHDDLSPAGSLEALIDALDLNPDAVLAYGPTQGIDLEGKRLPERDKPSPHPEQADEGWTLGLALQMYWRGHFDGAFKGLVRRRALIDHQLYVRSTSQQIGPERCWLFGLCLIGRYQFVPDALYIKRFYAGSTHTTWRRGHLYYLSIAHVMSGYGRAILPTGFLRRYCAGDLWFSAAQSAGQMSRSGYARAFWKLVGFAASITFAGRGSTRKTYYEGLQLPIPR